MKIMVDSNVINMDKYKDDDHYCPIIENNCLKIKCAWWDRDYNCCAILAISISL